SRRSRGTGKFFGFLRVMATGKTWPTKFETLNKSYLGSSCSMSGFDFRTMFFIKTSRGPRFGLIWRCLVRDLGFQVLFMKALLMNIHSCDLGMNEAPINGR